MNLSRQIVAYIPGQSATSGLMGRWISISPSRTCILKEGRAYFHVGGGIVADSEPDAESQETLDKAEQLAGLFLAGDVKH